MKVAVIGYGNVGMATFREIMDIPKVDELVLVGRNRDKMFGEIRDYLDTVPLKNYAMPKLSYGGYEATAGADIIVYTAGASKIEGGDRNELVNANVQITTDIFTEINKYNKYGIVIVLTNPLDVIVTAVCKITGRPASKVIGTGNMLETSRLIARISELSGISPKSILALCIGEHGNSSVIVRSFNTIYGKKICEMAGEDAPEIESLEKSLRETAFEIYNAKGNTSYGVATCAAKLVQSIADDTHEILPVSTVLNGEYGINGIAISVPCIIGREGRLDVHQIPLETDEWERLRASAEVIKTMCPEQIL